MNTIAYITVAAVSTCSTFTTTVPSSEEVQNSSFDNFLSVYNPYFTNDVVYEYQSEKDEYQNYLYVSSELQKFIPGKKEVWGSKRNFTYDYYYFCSTIGYLTFVDKRNKDKEYVNINYKIMIGIVSKNNYSDMIENLKGWKVIKENPHVKYQAGNYSKSYKLLSPYDSNLIRIPVEDRSINRKLNDFKRTKQKELEKLPEAYQYLSMTNKCIAMDVASATSFNEVNYFSQHEKKYNSNFFAISAYADDMYRFSVDTTGNRAHTNLTNLSSKLRQFLSVDGEQLGQVDISNSQPLFFYLHLKNNPSIPLSEKEKYKELVESGLFYEFFMEKLNIPIERRKKIKPKVLAAVFFDKHRRKVSRYMRVFREEFPSISDYITRLRRRDYKSLARMLQKTESKFVIEKVVAKFIEYYGDTNGFIATIHDSIVVKVGFLKYAKRLVEMCFESEGVNPKLKIEKFKSKHHNINPHITTTVVPLQSTPLCVLLSY